MLKIAVTGIIGSGKTYFCKALEERGYKVVYSDEIAKKLAEENENLKQEIINCFGEEAYTNEGKYNGKFISGIVFNNSAKMIMLNNVFKPYLIESFNNIEHEHGILFYESALVFEHKLQSNFDLVICTYAPYEKIRKRLVSRNGYSKEDIDRRLSSQYTQEYKMGLSDICINTDSYTYLSKLDLFIEKIINAKNIKHE